MSKEQVAVFEPYAFTVGQKINIASGPRGGDWEVIDVTDRKVKLRCPISGREFEWHRFCYLVEEREQEWPRQE